MGAIGRQERGDPWGGAQVLGERGDPLGWGASLDEGVWGGDGGLWGLRGVDVTPLGAERRHWLPRRGEMEAGMVASCLHLTLPSPV